MNRFFKVVFSIICAVAFCFGAVAQEAWAQEAKPRLGLSVSPLQASPMLLQHLRLSDGEGLVVENIVAGSEIEAAGLSQGDIVLAIDGHALTKPQDLTAYIATKKSGDQVTLDVIQKGEHRQIYAKLDNLPDGILWKYAKPVAGPGQSRLGSSPFGASVFGLPGSGGGAFGGAGNGGAGSGASGTQAYSGKSVFQSMTYDNGQMKSTIVTIDGPVSDDNSAIEVRIGENSWKTTIGEISKLPEEPRVVAENAINRSSRFSFSFGPADSMFEEMMNMQREQMERMNEMMQRQFAPNPGELKESDATGIDIQS